MEIYVRVLWGVILRDTQRNKYIYFYMRQITFLLHTLYNHKKLNNIYFIISINKMWKKHLN